MVFRKHIAMILVLCFMPFSVYSGKVTILIIAHLKQNQQLVMNTQIFREYYLLKRSYWPDAQKVILINRPAQSAIRKQVEHILGVEGKGYGLYLKRMHYKGKSLPLVVTSKNSVLDFVEKIPGALAYIYGRVPAGYKKIQVVGQLK